MEISKKTSQQVLIGTGLLLIVPMLIFPRQFGTELANATWVNACYELVVYGVILYFFNRGVGLAKLIQASSLCLIFRLTVGAIFGALIAFAYSMDFMVSMQLGLVSYLPAILFQVVVTPFVLLPGLKAFMGERSGHKRSRLGLTPAAQSDGGTASMAISRKHGVVLTPGDSPAPVPAREPISRQDKSAKGPNQEYNGFDRAVKYIGEHGSVLMIAVVDDDGLLLSQYTRSSFEPEDYAPMARQLFENNQATLGSDNFNLSQMERIDLSLKDERVVICRDTGFSILIIAERQSDDLLNIRINQGMDIICKYVQERFGPLITSNVENRYVPGTE